MKVVQVPKKTECEILSLSDLHVGAKHAALDQLMALLKDLPNHPNRYLLLLGDLANTAIIGSKSNVYEDELHPQQELELLQRLFMPVKDRILGIIPGNHEDRIQRQTGVEIIGLLATMLGAPYSDTSMVWEIPVGKQSYTIMGHHGSGGGRTTARFEGNHRLAQMVDADAFISGHIHSGHVSREGHYHTENGELRLHEQVFITTTSWLGYEAYAEKFAYKPSIIRPAILKLNPKVHDMEVVF